MKSKETDKEEQEPPQGKVAPDNKGTADANGENSLHDTSVGYLSAGRHEKAEQIYQRLIEDNPHDLTALNHYGLLCHIRGRLDEAVSLYSRVLEIDPDSPTAHRKLGNLYYDRLEVEDQSLSCVIAFMD